VYISYQQVYNLLIYIMFVRCRSVATVECRKRTHSEKRNVHNRMDFTNESDEREDKRV